MICFKLFRYKPNFKVMLLSIDKFAKTKNICLKIFLREKLIKMTI